MTLSWLEIHFVIQLALENLFKGSLYG